MILSPLCYRKAFSRKINVGETDKMEIGDDRKVSKCYVIRELMKEGLK